MGIVAFGWLAVQLGAKEGQVLHLVVDDEAGRFGARITLGSVRTDDAGGQEGEPSRQDDGEAGEDPLHRAVGVRMPRLMEAVSARARG
jgi:hypothetical protein